MKKSDNSQGSAKKRRRRQNDDTADWGSANAELLARTVATVTFGGGAIRFGYSRDGGAYAIGIYGDGKPYTEYLGAGGDVDEWLEGIRLDFE